MNSTIDVSIRLLFVIVVVLFYKNWSRIAAALKKQNPKSKKLIGVTEKILSLFRIRINNAFTSIILPILLVGGFLAYILSFNVNFAPPEPGVISLLNVIIVSPIYEEIMFRGLILGGFLLFFSWLAFKVIKWKENKITKFSVSTTSLFIVSVLFSIAHKGVLDLRYISGVIFGAVYLIDKKNLLPAIIGHSLNNLIVVLTS